MIEEEIKVLSSELGVPVSKKAIYPKKAYFPDYTGCSKDIDYTLGSSSVKNRY